MTTLPSESAGMAATDAGEAFEARILCVDAGCIGVVGADGRCKLCGLAGPELTDEQKAAIANTAAADPAQESAPDAEPLAADHAPPVEAAADEFDDRTLCPDAGCIGLLGTDGRCRVCGRAAS